MINSSVDHLYKKTLTNENGKGKFGKIFGVAKVLRIFLRYKMV